MQNMQQAIELYASVITAAIPFGLAFAVGDFIVSTFMRVAFGGSNLSWTRDRFYPLFSKGNKARATYFT